MILDDKERKIIHNIRRKTRSPRAVTRLSIILEADEAKDENITYKKVATKLKVSEPTVISVLKKYCTEGLDAAIKTERNPNSDTARLKATGDAEARIIATVCHEKPPEGHARWTLKLLEEESAVILEDMEITLSRSTIGRVLKRNALHPHLSEYWCIPPKDDAEFVANMEDVLDVYKMPYDESRPLVCMDEKPYQLLDEKRHPLPMRKGDIEKIDAEYVRNGVVSIFAFINPHTGEIWQMVEETRTAVDWAEKICYLADNIYPDKEKIILVMDNLNTHNIASLYKAFPPKEARRIASKLEVHYTPKHGSWLNIAEIALNIMTRQCLGRRIPGIEELRVELNAWEEYHRQKKMKIDWQFTTDDSRIKLKSLYPDIDKYYKERDKRRKDKKEKGEQ